MRDAMAGGCKKGGRHEEDQAQVGVRSDADPKCALTPIRTGPADRTDSDGDSGGHAPRRTRLPSLFFSDSTDAALAILPPSPNK